MEAHRGAHRSRRQGLVPCMPGLARGRVLSLQNARRPTEGLPPRISWMQCPRPPFSITSSLSRVGLARAASTWPTVATARGTSSSCSTRSTQASSTRSFMIMSAWPAGRAARYIAQQRHTLPVRSATARTRRPLRRPRCDIGRLPAPRRADGASRFSWCRESFPTWRHDISRRGTTYEDQCCRIREIRHGSHAITCMYPVCGVESIF